MERAPIVGARRHFASWRPLAVLLLAFGLGIGPAAAEWVEPFSEEPADLVAQAAALEPGAAAVVVLREYRRLTFADNGALTDEHYRVYRVVTQDGADGWDATEVSWSPWFQARPEIRARVITSDGTVHELDLATLSEQPVEVAPDIFTDDRILAAPLPAVTVGSVVEEWIVTRETAPAYVGGWIHAYTLADFAQIAERGFVLEYPGHLPIRHELVHYDLAEVERDESDGTVRIVFDLPQPKRTEFEDFFRYDAKLPMFAVSTGESWAQVALAYHEIVEEKLEDFDPDLDVVDAARDLADPRGAAVELSRWMYGMVRYTGLNFGDSGLVPTAPSEVLGRRYGDCKDQAVLLTGLLRASGYGAEVVILDTDKNELPESLVGLGQFDHAIVRVVADPPLWIDPTAPVAPVGTLPASDQGRRALVISPATTGLSETPQSTSADNRTVETRELFLPEWGRSRIVETTEATGEIELRYRGRFGEMTEEEIREAGEEYMADYYLTESLGEVEHSRLDDPEDPFLLRFEGVEAGIAVTNESVAAARLSPFVLFSRAPDELWRGEAQDEEGETLDDTVMIWPYSFALRYRIHPPDGFEPRDLPEPESHRFGDIVLSWTFREAEDGTIEADLDFDTGKRRITPEHAAELRDVVGLLREDSAFLVEFDHVGHSLLAAGQVAEAIEEFRSLQERHPESAVHRARLAAALVDVGLGEAARDHAKRAVELDDESVFAYRTLGHVLKHDIVGRAMARGADYRGAVAAFERAHELDPEDSAAWSSLAELRQYDDDGRHKDTDEGLTPALETYLELRRTLEDTSWDTQILDLYVRMERYDELLEFIEESDLTVELAAHRLAVIAANRGTKVALRTISSYGTEYRAPILGQAGVCLLKMRRYPEAAAMLRAGSVAGGGNEGLGFAGLVEGVRPWEDVAAELEGPQAVAARLIGEQLSTGNVSWSTDDFSERWRDVIGDLDLDEEAAAMAVNQQIEDLVATVGLTTETLADLSLSLLDFEVEGSDEAGYRLEFHAPSDASFDGHTYVLLEKGEYRLFPAEDSGAEGAMLALLALDQLEDGRTEDAARWLGWVTELQVSAPPEDPYGGALFSIFWGPDVEPTADNARLAIAMALSACKATAKRSLKMLEGVEDLGGDRQPFLDLAKSWAFQFLEDYEDAVSHAELAYEAVPDSPTISAFLVTCLVISGEEDRARATAEEFLERHPDDLMARALVADLAMRRDDLAEAEAQYREMLRSEWMAPAACNQIAWISLFLGDTDEEDVRLAHRAVEHTGREPDGLHTLACVYAEVGQVMEAKQVAHEAMRQLAQKEPQPMFWLVFGRIAEQLGEFEAAEVAYRRAAEADDRDELGTVSSPLLADRWLERLERARS